MTIQWSIDKIATMPQCGELENVVMEIDWRCTATEGEASQSTYGRISFTGPDRENFTEYNDLTEADIIQWVKDSLGEERVLYNENLATTRVHATINPIKKETPLPW